MSLANKQARAEQLRGELSALRSAREAALVDAHYALTENKVDAELVMLEAQVAEESAALKAVVGSGSVDDAKAAMEAAAASDSPGELTPELPDEAPVTEAPVPEATVDAEVNDGKATDSRGARKGGK
jgi:hypothetical protein